jgi:hypothetical protein
MKLTTLALATALALTSSAALARANYAPSTGSHVAPSVGSYVAPLDPYMNQPIWTTTGPAAPPASRSALAPISIPFPIVTGIGW